MYQKVDPVTLQVIYQRLSSIAEEMENALLKSSYSSIVKEARDASSAVFNAKGQTVAQSCAIPFHLGTLRFSVPQILREFPIQEAQDGDVYLANDPYSGGTHLPDVTLVTPIIYQGEVVALGVSMVHHQDMGAMAPGVPTSATSLYQEGLNLPPVKFFEAGKPVKAIHDIIRKNVRVPDLVLGDIGAQVAAGNVGKARVLELFDEHGKDLVLAAMDQLMDYAEVMIRQELEKIPDGTHTFVDYMDNDGIDLDKRIKIQVSITIKGSDFIADFTGTDPQVRGPVNCVPSSTIACVAYVMKGITGGGSIPNNEGSFRPLKFILPEGSLVNPKFPAACGVRVTAGKVIVQALMGAIAQFVPERVSAAAAYGFVLYCGGTDPLNDKEYLVTLFEREGGPARMTKDGVDAIATDIVNTAAPPIESHEMSSPYRVLECKLREDSGGAGKYRGGLGVEKSYRLLRGNNASVTFRGERMTVSPWGICGGKPGVRGKGVIIRKTGEREEIRSKKDFHLNEGDEYYLAVPGGGGYGDPLERNPESVLRDVLDGRVSLKAAVDDYGVIIDEETMTINEEKTVQLRENKTRARGPVTWTFDRGEDGRE